LSKIAFMAFRIKIYQINNPFYRELVFGQ